MHFMGDLKNTGQKEEEDVIAIAFRIVAGYKRK